MAFYESVFIARQDISTTQVDELTETFSKIIEKGGGKIAKKESWGLRALAFKIKKNRKGHYVQLSLDAPAEAVHEMERLMRLNEDLLRYLTVRVDELDSEPSFMMRARPDRDERPRGRFDRDDRPRRDERPREQTQAAGDTVKSTDEAKNTGDAT